MNAALPDKLLLKLKKRFEEGKLRSLQLNKGQIDFCSNDYLGIAREIDLNTNTAERLPAGQLNGSTGSRLIRGNSLLAERLEKWLAEFHRADAALLFNSGYDANVGFFSAVPQRGDTILYDRFIHASVHDGIRLSHAKAFAFEHNDITDLKRLIARSEGQIYVAVESLYSMDGDTAPLNEIAAVCKESGALMVVDEAHATGVCGEQGRGLGYGEEISATCVARIITFGKAIGVHGAAIIGSEDLSRFLVNYARSFIYTTALPPHELIRIQAAYSCMIAADEQRQQLNENIAFYQQLAQAQTRYEYLKADGPIQGIVVPGNANVKELSKHLQEEGLDIRAILSPTVPEGKERLRICIHSFNTPSEIKLLFDTLLNFSPE